MRKTVGTQYIERDGKLFCPLCNTEIDDEYIPGYGLAGGGIGTYWYCSDDKCDWFYKVMDEE